jgi:hypothetical protein
MWIDVKTGKRIGDKYDQVMIVERPQKDWIFRAKRGNNWFIVTPKKEIGPFGGINLIWITPSGILAEVNYGKVFDTYWVNIDSNGKLLPDKFEMVLDTATVFNTMYFKAIMNGKHGWFKMRNNELIGDLFDDVSMIDTINGRGFIKAKKDDKKIVLDAMSGKALTPFFDEISGYPYFYHGKFIIAAKDKGRAFWVELSKERIREEWGMYADVCCLSSSNGSVYAKKDGDSFWVRITDGTRFTEKELVNRIYE